MKKIYAVLVLGMLLLLPYMANALDTKITGKAIGAGTLRLKVVNIDYNGTMLKLSLNDQKEFSEVLEIEKPQFIKFIAGGQNNYLYVIPERPINLLLEKTTYPLKDILTREDKELDLVDQVINTFLNSLENQGIKLNEKNWQSDAFEQFESVEKAMNDATDFYTTNSTIIDKVAPEFKADFALMTTIFKKYISIDHYTLAELGDNLKDISTSDMKFSHLSLPFFNDYLNDLCTAYAARKMECFELNLDPQTYHLTINSLVADAIANNIPNQEIKNILFYKIIDSELKVNGLERENYLSFLFNNVDAKAVTSLYETYQDLKQKQTQTGERELAFPFEVQDVNGEIHTMDEFKGKMVYIDLWATWCAPCKMQIPYIKKLEEYYTGKDIEFVSISLDQTREAWIGGIESENLHGNVFWANGDFKHPLPVHYNVKSIPRFLLIDATGKIISDDAIRPSQIDQLKELINKELYKKDLQLIVEKHIQKVGGEKLVNGLGVSYDTKVSMFGLDMLSSMYYEYPKKMRTENFQIGAKDRSDRSKQVSTAMNGDVFLGSAPNTEKLKASWMNKLSGLELFVMDKVLGANYKFAEENFNNEDNEYVLQTNINNKLYKIFIGKEDLLIHKVLDIVAVLPRDGGGTQSFSYEYDNYKEINGVYTPQKIKANGMVNVVVEKVEVKDLDDKIFTDISN